MDNQLKQYQQELYAEIYLINLANMLIGDRCLLYPYEIYKEFYSYDEMIKYVDKYYCGKVRELIDYIINIRVKRVNKKWDSL